MTQILEFLSFISKTYGTGIPLVDCFFGASLTGSALVFLWALRSLSLRQSAKRSNSEIISHISDMVGTMQVQVFELRMSVVSELSALRSEFGFMKQELLEIRKHAQKNSKARKAAAQKASMAGHTDPLGELGIN